MVRWIRYGEMWIVYGFVQLGEMLGLFGDEGYKIYFQGKEYDWQTGFEATPEYPKQRLSYFHLSFFNALAMQPMRIALFAVCCLGALWCMFKGPRTHYRTRMGLEGLIKRQSSNFPVIAPFADFNPATQPPRPPGSPVPAELPCFAEALGPEEWLAYYNIPVPDGVLDEDAAAKAFKKQLIGRWKGPMALKPYQQILLAAFCLKAARKRNESDDMLGRLALCWTFKGGLKLGKDKNPAQRSPKSLEKQKPLRQHAL